MIISRVLECIPDLSQFTDGLLTKFQHKYELTCSKKYGFILKVLNIVKINTCKISIYNGNSIMECDIEVECLLPEINQKVTGIITHVYPQGIIIIVHDCMKVFIPTSSKSKKQVGDCLNVVITQIRFQKGKYDCIASMID